MRTRPGAMEEEEMCRRFGRRFDGIWNWSKERGRIGISGISDQMSKRWSCLLNMRREHRKRSWAGEEGEEMELGLHLLCSHEAGQGPPSREEGLWALCASAHQGAPCSSPPALSASLFSPPTLRSISSRKRTRKASSSYRKRDGAGWGRGRITHESTFQVFLFLECLLNLGLS